MTKRLLVVGGGIAGFGMARALLLRGVPCSLVERLPEPPVAGMGLNLPGNAVRALAALGLADEVAARGVPIRPGGAARSVPGRLPCRQQTSYGEAACRTRRARRPDGSGSASTRSATTRRSA